MIFAKKKFRYFFSYVFNRDGYDTLGFGNCDITLDKKIKSIFDLNKVSEILEKEIDGKKFIILNYQLLKEEN